MIYPWARIVLQSRRFLSVTCIASAVAQPFSTTNNVKTFPESPLTALPN